MNWTTFAQWLATVAAIFALLLTVWQLRQNNKLACQNFARTMWMEYLRLGLDNPDLGETRFTLRHLRIAKAEDLVAGNTIDSQRYLWFLTVMLDAGENLLRHMPKERWHVTVQANVRYHKEALTVLWPTEKTFYSDEFDAVVQGVLDEK